jgi:hypothetical protein
MDNEQLKRIADALEKTTNYRTGEVTELRGIRNALEEVLRLVKEDQERSRKYMEDKKDD